MCGLLFIAHCRKYFILFTDLRHLSSYIPHRNGRDRNGSVALRPAEPYAAGSLRRLRLLRYTCWPPLTRAWWPPTSLTRWPSGRHESGEQFHCAVIKFQTLGIFNTLIQSILRRTRGRPWYPEHSRTPAKRVARLFL